MDEHPYQPGQEPGQSDPTSLQHCKILADDCHISFVEISERTPGHSAFELLGNHPTDVVSLLDRNLGHTRQRSFAFYQGRHVAHSENAVDARHHQKRVDWESSGSIGWDAKCLHDRRSRDARRPQDGRARYPLSSRDDALLVYLFDLHSRHDFDAQLLKPSGGFPGQGLGKRRQDSVAAVEQNDRRLRGVNAAKVST